MTSSMRLFGFSRHKARLLFSLKLGALGTLAGGVAHDFNNILSVIMGYAALVIEDVPERTLTQRSAEGILAASRRAKTLIPQLLTFSRPGQHSPRPVHFRKNEGRTSWGTAYRTPQISSGRAEEISRPYALRRT